MLLRLPPELIEWVRKQGGASWVRRVLEREKQAVQGMGGSSPTLA